VDCSPFESAAIAAYPSKAAWDAESAELVRTMLDRWHLRALRPIGEGFAAATLQVLTESGHSAVLKVGFPHPEGIWEAVAVEASGPSLAPRVLRQDPWTWSMLLSEVAPGTTLASLPVDEALRVGGELMNRLARVDPPDGMPTLVDSVAQFVAGARDRRASQSALLRELGSTASVNLGFELADALDGIPRETSLVHGDLNPSNILLDATCGWLVIDPKPMIGDPAYDAWPLIGQVGGAHSRELGGAEIVRRIRRLSEQTGLPDQRVREWCVVRAALSLTWYVDDHLVRHAEREAAALETLVDVLGGAHD